MTVDVALGGHQTDRRQAGLLLTGFALELRRIATKPLNIADLLTQIL